LTDITAERRTGAAGWQMYAYVTYMYMGVVSDKIPEGILLWTLV